ncbi:MAG: peptide ABC transporter substrate-binding protein [Cellulosilyticaceae bacterium]
MVQKLKKVLLIGVASMVVLVGCGTKEETTPPTPPKEVSEEKPTNQNEDSLIYISMQNPTTLHPIYNMERSVQQNLHLIFDTLVDIEEDGSISPNLAESWSYMAEENAMTVRLRDDIKWQDGTPLTSEDVVFTLKTIQEAKESPYKLTTKNIANVQALDAQTVKIAYRQSFSGTLQTLFFPVIPKHVYDLSYEQSLQVNPVGSGAYKYASNIPYKEVTLEANETYFAGVPSIETIKIMITPDNESELNAFEQNLIDVIYTDVMDWGKYAKDQSAEVYEMHTQYYEFMGVNFNKPLFQNKNIRDVLAYGLDRQYILNTYYLGHGTVTDTPISPHSFLADPTLEVKGYDKEKAKLLLVQEGYVFDQKTKCFTKNDQPLRFSLLVNKENKDRLSVAKGIQKMYEEIGIQVTIEEVDGPTYKERIYNKQYEAFLGGWKLSYVPDLTFAFHSSQINTGDNFVSYKNERMDELLTHAFNASPLQIKEVYGMLQQHIAQENPYISLYFRNGALITKKKITGDLNPTPLNIYAHIESWKLNK